jgi:hypothetical protein
MINLGCGASHGGCSLLIGSALRFELQVGWNDCVFKEAENI